MLGSALPCLLTNIPGPKSKVLARQLRQVESRNTTFISSSWPIFWERANGVNVWDVDGNRFLDLTSAFSVANIGHAHPKVVHAIRQQVGKLIHAMGDVHPSKAKVELARELVKLTFRRWNKEHAHVIFTNTGAEAVEVALKTALLHTNRPGVIAFEGAYHGLSYGALEVTWRSFFRKPFRSQLKGFTKHITFGTIPKQKNLHNFGAVLLEPIQGRGGIVLPPNDFLQEIRKFCDQHQLLLIVDEIYTGFCRTGKWFACEHWDIIPDIVCVGKAMGGGFPISACIGRRNVMQSWPESSGESLHTTTFLGNPLGCVAGLSALSAMKKKSLWKRSEQLGNKILKELIRSLSELPMIRNIRGKGLMIGIEFTQRRKAVLVTEKLLKKGLIVLPEGNNSEVLGITPPLTITEKQIDYAIRIITETILQVARS